MEERVTELEAREYLDDNVKQALDDMVKIKKQIEKNMTWVNASKIETALKKQTDFEEWWNKKTEQQAKLPLHEAPAFTAKDVNEKLDKLRKEWDKLKKIKKPKEAKAKDGNKTSKAKGKAKEELPATVEATEKELNALKEKKAAA